MDMDMIRTAVMLEDANKILRRLYPDYEEQVKEPRKTLRAIMEQIKTNNPLKALTEALQRTLNKFGEGTQTTQVCSLWLISAAVDLCQEKGE